MGGLSLFGMVVFAFGPSAALLLNVVAQRSQLVILMVTAAFFCLLALMVIGFLWYVIDAFKENDALTVVFGVLFIEALRYGFLRVYRNGDQKVREMTGSEDLTPFSDFSSAIASGLGFGFMYSLIMYGGMLQASRQPGDLFTESCPGVSGFVVSALLALYYQVLNILFTILMLDGLRQGSRSQRLTRVALVVVLHLAVSLFGLMNGDESIGCKVGLPIQTLVLLASIGETLRTIKRSDYAVNHNKSS